MALVVMVAPSSAVADASIRSASINAMDDGYTVNADFQLDLNPRLVDAVQRGVSLYFTVTFVVDQPRRFWFDSVIIERKLEYRLSYHPITRSYRLSLGSLHQNFDSLESALRTMRRLRNWYVMDQEDLLPEHEYRAALRMRHEVELLPKPLLVTATGGREWALSTSWLRWDFTPEALK